jgi:mRNA interferase MazF
MKRGEVWWVNFDPSVGGEIQKQRPAVIVSNDAANKHLNRVQVVPLTSKVGPVYPSEEVALVAFYAKEDNGADWRFSLVTVEQKAELNAKGKVTLKAVLSPAKRYS